MYFRIVFRKGIPLLLLTFIFAACVTTLPASTPAPTPSQTTPEEASPAPTPLAALEEQEVASETVATPSPPSVATPPPPPAPTPTPTPVVIPAAEFARDQALAFLRNGYKLKLPANKSFKPVELSHESIDVVAAYASKSWQVLVGISETAARPNTATVLVRNTKSDDYWWGEVDIDGLVSTILSAGLPRPPSKRVKGWRGRVVTLPAGSPYDNYFEDAKGNRFGVESNKEGVQETLARLKYYDGRVQIWGELRYAVDDYNARHILVKRIKLLDGPLPDVAEQTAAEGGSEYPTPTPFFGPTGALTQPLPGDVLQDKVIVAGEAEGIFENTVLIRIETDTGEVLAQGAALTDAPDVGLRGSFVAELQMENPSPTDAGRVALYTESARDGSLILLAWVNILFAPPRTEKSATLLTPEEGATVKGSVRVSGVASGVNEQTVLVQAEDAAGTVWGKASAKVDGAGVWEVLLRVTRPTTARAGRISVYDVEPNGDKTLLASVEVRLAR